MREKHLNEFVETILRIEKELDSLSNYAYDISALYNKNLFVEQTNLSVEIENLAIAMTHETASQMGFMRNNLVALAHFIEFREKYDCFSDEELEEILDGNISLELKQTIFQCCNSAKNTILQINELQSAWSNYFRNASYSKQKKKLRL